MPNELITQQIAILFDRLNKLHHALFKSGRCSESDEVTIMALRLRQIAAGESAPVGDPRPSDPAELARMTAIELRKRAIYAYASNDEVYYPRPEKAFSGMPTLKYGCAMMFRDVFARLGPIACADEIQRQEAARAKEIAGDS